MDLNDSEVYGRDAMRYLPLLLTSAAGVLMGWIIVFSCAWWWGNSWQNWRYSGPALPIKFGVFVMLPLLAISFLAPRFLSSTRTMREDCRLLPEGKILYIHFYLSKSLVVGLFLYSCAASVILMCSDGTVFFPAFTICFLLAFWSANFFFTLNLSVLFRGTLWAFFWAASFVMFCIFWLRKPHPITFMNPGILFIFVNMLQVLGLFFLYTTARRGTLSFRLLRYRYFVLVSLFWFVSLILFHLQLPLYASDSHTWHMHSDAVLSLITISTPLFIAMPLQVLANSPRRVIASLQDAAP